MKNFLDVLDKTIFKVIRGVGQTADRFPVSAYLVGGFVRDIFLRRKNLDVDIVLEGDAIALAKNYARQHNSRIIIYERFGTATIELKTGLRVDFATARKESYAHAGALPVVESGNIEDDLFRRDFTVNAMAMCINRKRFGELVDEFHGLADLRTKKIRILHEKSFADDPTRILRAVRFEQRFQFTMEKKTFQLLKTALAQNYPRHVKPERYFAEFKKILEEEMPQRCLVRLAVLRGLKFLSEDLKISVKQLLCVSHNINVLEKKAHIQKAERWILYFMSVLENLSVSKVEELLAKFNLRKADRVKILAVRDLERGVKIFKKDSAPSEIYQILKPFPRETILFARVNTSNKIIHKHIDDFFKKYHDAALDIDGYDLKRIGVAAGNRMRWILNEILYKKLDGVLGSRREQMEEAKQLQGGR